MGYKINSFIWIKIDDKRVGAYRRLCSSRLIYLKVMWQYTAVGYLNSGWFPLVRLYGFSKSTNCWRCLQLMCYSNRKQLGNRSRLISMNKGFWSNWLKQTLETTFLETRSFTPCGQWNPIDFYDKKWQLINAKFTRENTTTYQTCFYHNLKNVWKGFHDTRASDLTQAEWSSL